MLVEAQCSGLYCIVSDTINHDVKLTDNLAFLSLSSGKQVWSKAIEKVLDGFARSSQSKILASKGYSIAETVKYLEDVYENMK